MTIFSNHKIKFTDLLRKIPETELTRLSQQTNVDYFTKI